MLKRLTFAAGFGAGYVLGARAGRTRYDMILRAVRDLKDNPSVQETAGVLQAQATTAFDTAKKAVSDKVTHKVGGRDATAPPFPPTNGETSGR